MYRIDTIPLLHASAATTRGRGDFYLKAAYEQYTETIEDAVIAGEIVIQHTVNMGIWADSKTLNRYLC